MFIAAGVRAARVHQILQGAERVTECGARARISAMFPSSVHVAAFSP